MPRWTLIGFAALSILLGAEAVARADAETIRIVMLGDDILFGYGVRDPADRLPDRLKAQLVSEGHPVEIVESPSVDSSKGAVIWLGTRSAKAVLDNPTNAVAILGVGHWDCGVMSLAQTAANLAKIVEAFDQRDIPVLVVATKPRTFCGAEYNAAYPAIFPALSEELGTLLYVDPKEPPPDERPEGVNYVTEPVSMEGLLPAVRMLIDRLK